MAFLDQLKTYLRIDGAEDDTILGLLIGAAKGYLADAGIPEIDPETHPDPERAKLYADRYDLAVMQHVAMNYEGRDATDDGKFAQPKRFAIGFQSVVLQLQIEAQLLGGDETG